MYVVRLVKCMWCGYLVRINPDRRSVVRMSGADKQMLRTTCVIRVERKQEHVETGVLRATKNIPYAICICVAALASHTCICVAALASHTCICVAALASHTCICVAALASHTCICLYDRYRVVPGHRNWQIETERWNWAGFFTVGLETRWQRIGQFLNDL